ncbi:hypothetical protein VTK56DRAFT_3594 [Thermocarpiscus australiensis]
MADTGIYELKNDLRMSMTIAAFTGISWYIGAEINTSLFLLFKRCRGLYFWSAALSSWGVVLQPLFIILGDYGIWTDLKGSIVMIYLTWLIMVIPQSWLLYSRLHLIAHHETMLRWIKMVLIFTSIVFSVPTIIIGTIAQATDISPGLFAINLAWDRVQLTVYFVQETALSLLYIWQARKYLHNSSLLSQQPYLESTVAGSSTTAPTTRAAPETRQLLLHLVFANVLVIALDIALLGVQYAGLFYLQGAFKPCVYGVKLKVEFAILNRLVDLVRRHGRGTAGGPSSYPSESGGSRGGVGLFRATGGGGGGRGGGGPSPQSVGQSQPQIISVSRFGESKWEEEEEERPDETCGHEQIGLGQLDHLRPAAGPSRSHSHESQDPIWDGQRRGRADGEGAVASFEPSTTVQQSQWGQVYHG